MKYKGRVELDKDYDNLSISLVSTLKKNGINYLGGVDLVGVFNDLDGKEIELTIKVIEKKEECV